MYKMIFRGFRFGMLLQIAIGPVCLFVLKTAINSGTLVALSAVVAATIADAIFVALAIIGVGAFLNRLKIKKLLKYVGVAVLAYFGAGIILASFSVRIMPGIEIMTSSIKTSNAFIACFILTVSNPLTILFWAGIFASKMADNGYCKADMKYYGAGAVLTTLFFLGAVAIVAGLLYPIVKQDIMIVNLLNITVGIVLILFAIKMVFKKE